MRDSDAEERQTFNSRPHKEVDVFQNNWYHVTVLSIHDLTRRSTGTMSLLAQLRDLSIHDLTRRSTRSR